MSSYGKDSVDSVANRSFFCCLTKFTMSSCLAIVAWAWSRNLWYSVLLQQHDNRLLSKLWEGIWVSSSSLKTLLFLPDLLKCCVSSSDFIEKAAKGVISKLPKRQRPSNRPPMSPIHSNRLYVYLSMLFCSAWGLRWTLFSLKRLRASFVGQMFF